VKDLVEMENGEKLAPQLAESRLRFSPYIKDAWVFAGPNRAYTSAVIIINYDNVSRWAGQRRIAYTTFTELAQRPEVYDLIKQDIDRVNQTMPPGSRVRKYVNLHKEFNPDEGELTRNRKLKRTFLEEQYREVIDAIYHDETEVLVEVRAGSREGRMATTEARISIKSVEGGA
jgi:long-chain acyl-CoA synthetase